MKIRAILFDIYKTLLEIGPPLAEAPARWEKLWQDTFSAPPRITLAAFAAGAEQIIAREHTAARKTGINYPEIFWPTVARELLPELEPLDDAAREEFLFTHAQLQRTAWLAPEASLLLEKLLDRGVPFGLASNCQSYTLFELAAAFDGSIVSLASFQPDLCFLSYKHGFSKPDPYAFRLLAARLRARNILTGETLMVGDRLDNDIAPAQAQGFQTWHLTAAPGQQPNAGNWEQLTAFLT